MFLEILLPHVPQQATLSYVCIIIIHIIYEWHAEARGGIYSTAERRKQADGYLHRLYLKYRLKSLFL